MLANHRDAGQENSLELPALPASLTVTAARSLKCPRDGVIVFGDLIGKLDVRRLACTEYKRAYVALMLRLFFKWCGREDSTGDPQKCCKH